MLTHKDKNYYEGAGHGADTRVHGLCYYLISPVFLYVVEGKGRRENHFFLLR